MAEPAAVPGTNQPDPNAVFAQLLNTLQNFKPQTSVDQATPDQLASARASLPGVVPISGQTSATPAAKEPEKNSGLQNVMAFLGSPDASAPQAGDQGSIGKIIQMAPKILDALGL